MAEGYEISQAAKEAIEQAKAMQTHTDGSPAPENRQEASNLLTRVAQESSTLGDRIRMAIELMTDPYFACSEPMPCFDGYDWKAAGAKAYYATAESLDPHLNAVIWFMRRAEDAASNVDEFTACAEQWDDWENLLKETAREGVARCLLGSEAAAVSSKDFAWCAETYHMLKPVNEPAMHRCLERMRDAALSAEEHADAAAMWAQCSPGDRDILRQMLAAAIDLTDEPRDYEAIAEAADSIALAIGRPALKPPEDPETPPLSTPSPVFVNAMGGIEAALELQKTISAILSGNQRLLRQHPRAPRAPGPAPDGPTR